MMKQKEKICFSTHRRERCRCAKEQCNSGTSLVGPECYQCGDEIPTSFAPFALELHKKLMPFGN